MPPVVATVLYYALFVFWLLMIFRLVMDYVFMFRRSYRASGPMALLLEAAYTVTDPPLKALRRVLPPIRMGSFSFDLGFLLVLIVTRILMNIVATYR